VCDKRSAMTSSDNDESAEVMAVRTLSHAAAAADDRRLSTYSSLSCPGRSLCLS